MAVTAESKFFERRGWSISDWTSELGWENDVGEAGLEDTEVETDSLDWRGTLSDKEDELDSTDWDPSECRFLYRMKRSAFLADLAVAIASSDKFASSHLSLFWTRRDLEESAFFKPDTS